MSTRTPIQKRPPRDLAAGARPPRRALALQTLLQMAVGIAVVIIALASISYERVMSTITHQAVDDLRNYIKVRGEREQAIFDLAYDNQQAIKIELVHRIHDYRGLDPDEEFDRRYRVDPDGAVRSRRESFDPKRMAGVVIMNRDALDPDLKRRILASHDTLEQMGRALHPRFQNIWMAMPENLSLGYWPEQIEALFRRPAQSNFLSSSMYQRTTPQSNPERKSIWAGTYIDGVTNLSMISISTPVYDQDRFVGSIGHDITLDELQRRTLDVRLEGTENLILAPGGEVIAHRMLMDAMMKANGHLSVADTGDPELQSIFRTASTLERDYDVLEDTGSDSYLGVVRIRGPEWYLITVYPKKLIQRAAREAAEVVLLGGFVALLLEMFILHTILRRQVTAPLGLLLGATKKVASGDMDVDVDVRRDDELGELATSFNTMASAVRDREEHLRQLTETLRQSEERFRLLFERSADALLLLDGEVFIDCNAAAVALMQCQGASDLISKRLADLSPEKQPDGSLSAAKAGEVQQIAIEHGSHRFEWRLRRANGEEFPMEGLITAIPLDGKPTLYAVFRDITERKLAEEKNQALTAELAVNLEREIEKNEQLRRLHATVDVLGTPVLEVWDDVLVLPVIGSVDDRRSTLMIERLLDEVVRMKSRFVIVDVTGLHAIDAPTTDRLVKLVRTVELLGARCILTGIGPDMAMELVALEVDIEKLVTLGTLRSGLRECIQRLSRDARKLGRT